jgi:transcriptional regulator GlxA family with amidase domain
MFWEKPDNLPQQIGFHLVPHFSMMSFASAIEPLRSANRLAGNTLYEWSIFAENTEPVPASNGIAVVPERPLAEVERFPALILCSGTGTEDYFDNRLFGQLRRLARNGAQMGGLSGAPLLLARAGLLGERRCTLHWEHLPGFVEEFPDIEVTGDLFEIDGPIFTCAGGSASMDMMLHLISLQHGHDLAAAVSEQFIHDRIREPTDRQRMALRMRIGHSHPKLVAAISFMEDNLENPVTPPQLARSIGLSSRQLERLFRKYMGCTPARYYLEQRLKRARALLRQTSLSVLDVAVACGFASASHFSKRYRDLFGQSPRSDRNAA